MARRGHGGAAPPAHRASGARVLVGAGKPSRVGFSVLLDLGKDGCERTRLLRSSVGFALRFGSQPRIRRRDLEGRLLVPTADDAAPGAARLPRAERRAFRLVPLALALSRWL